MFAILGSGFGLYGYLPALVEGCGQQIVLPERYRARLEARSELSRFAGAVQWEPNDRSALDRVTGVAIALRPSDQSDLVTECLARSNIRYLLLEKPLAPSPERAMALLESLAESGKTFRVSYILRNTSWGKQLLNALHRGHTGGRLTIRWRFMAHHFQKDLHNWKRFAVSGGGPIRFYGIHVIALLAEAGYSDVVSSETFGSARDEPENWIAVLAGPRLPDCEVVVDTRSAARTFQIELTSSSTSVSLAALGDPFDSDSGSSTTDRRVSALTEVCRSLWDETGNDYSRYEATNQLWRNVEDRTRFVAEALPPA